MTKRTSLMLLLMLTTLPAVAAELEGVTMPDAITVDGKTLELNGLGMRKASRLFLKFDVYVAGLYVEETSADPQTILDSGNASRIRMQFVRKVKKKDIAKAWSEGFEKNAADLSRFETRIDDLNGWMEDMGKTDTMSFTWLPGSGVNVAVNGEDKGTIAGDDFGRVLWSIWLGPEPPNPELKQGMLGGS